MNLFFMPMIDKLIHQFTTWWADITVRPRFSPAPDSAAALQGKWPNGVTYEIFVQSFSDSNADGIGDLNGLTSRLDYLKDLGIEAVWLMPISPSPSYHKYDVSDYYAVHPDYGSLEDFKRFVREAHLRHIKVIIDLVVNHTSDQHPWFQQAAADKNSQYRNYYIWADAEHLQEKGETRLKTADSDNVHVWHTLKATGERYYGLFGGNMPDLNYESPEVHEEVFRIGRFWIELGVDGFRLDAAKHIYSEHRHEDNCHWWEKFRAEMQKIKPDMYLVGEVWSDAHTVAKYLKGLPAMFNFDMAEAITKALVDERHNELIHHHNRNLALYHSVTKEFTNAIFLSNHDQKRIFSALFGHTEKAKLAASILLTLSGSPFLYYGEELGMAGEKPDEHIREPFLWQAENKDKERCRWIEPKYATPKYVQALNRQWRDKYSMYQHYRRLIRLRNQSEILTFGEATAVDLHQATLCAFLRTYHHHSLMVIHNLSWQEQEIQWKQLLGYEHIIFHTKDLEMSTKSLKIPSYSSLILEKKTH
jgi:alpha-amylase